jgi:ACS family D-galactonate transporter-like MFS transporter
VIYVLSPAIVSEFTPVSQRGAMLTIITAVATSAGLLAPYVMGALSKLAPLLPKASTRVS